MKKYVFPFILLFLLVTMFSLLPGRIPSIFAKDTGVKVVILGDSISAGLGVEPEQAFPFLVQDMLKQKGFDVVKIINGSISGSTTAGATSRLKWYLKSKPDILVLALGANDGLRGLSIDLMTQNLEKSIILAKKNGIKVILAGMKIPPNYGAEYAKAFESSFVSLAQKHDLPFIEFLLKDVAGKAFLNQADGIHPNPEGHKIIATTVFDILLEQL
ncbi:arylesterase [Desulfobacula sp.]|uniref:arylesterase n=1 Tax=Desulfobacula sp. TaxID=2593537 RepID=UPI0039B9A504